MSIVKANEWQLSNGTKVGTVVQVVTSTRTDAVSLSSTSWADTGLSCTITPRTATNKILVQYLLSMSVNGHGGCRLIRNSTAILLGDSSGSRTQATHWLWSQGGTSFNYSMMPMNNCYLDSPATTSAVTYKLQFAHPYSTGYYMSMNYHSYNDGNDTWAGRVASVMTLMEIQA
jgi:hypothetical protein